MHPPRFELVAAPTPLQPAPRLGDWLGGVDLWIKRDDLTGLAFGGNKTRKLEFLVGEALARGCDTLLTAGAAQSNHCRQTAAAAARAGLQCHLALGGEAPARPEGNLLLDRLLGAHLHWCGEHRKGEDLPALRERLRSEGRRPYVVVYGGSDPVGATGFVEAARELRRQCEQHDLHFDHVVIASSSGGTQAGLIVGFEDDPRPPRLIGIRVDKTDATAAHAESIWELARTTAAFLGRRPPVDRERLVLRDDALYAAYGEVTAHEREAIRAAARLEGLLLDPVYTGRALAGLIALARAGEFGSGERVLFWHTGGTPALFGSAADLLTD